MGRKKLALDPEKLRVESFDTLTAGGLRGTVLGNTYTAPGYPSCAVTCGASPPPGGDTSLCAAGYGTDPKQCCV